METPLNHNRPLVMHADLNSCFATVCQQAHVLLRGRPVAIAAYASPNGCVLSPSIEAKTYGIKVGMRVREAKLLCPQLIVREPDTVMVRDVHVKYRKIFTQYCPSVVPKSIDEVVLDFNGMEKFLGRSLTQIGQEIKTQLKEKIGDWISVSIGIGTNRFWAKTAASLHKPDGLEVIDDQRIEPVLNRLSLMDLCGINTRYTARLNAAGIFTPRQFLAASAAMLHKKVFGSIEGHRWYLRLRGYEVDAREFARKSFGQDYALAQPTRDVVQLTRILMKLCEKMGRRLRRSGHSAYGLHLACLYDDRTFWHHGHKGHHQLYTTRELFLAAQRILTSRPENKVVVKLSVSCFALQPLQTAQLNLFDQEEAKQRLVSRAVDSVNDHYGEFTLVPATMMGMDNMVVDRIAFGGMKELEDLYN